MENALTICYQMPGLIFSCKICLIYEPVIVLSIADLETSEAATSKIKLTDSRSLDLQNSVDHLVAIPLMYYNQQPQVKPSEPDQPEVHTLSKNVSRPEFDKTSSSQTSTQSSSQSELEFPNLAAYQPYKGLLLSHYNLVFCLDIKL